MAKRRRELDSDGITAETAEYNAVFVDTSLDTHIAMLVSNFDTVSDFKNKLVSEHMQCFPKIGEIQIHALKAKRGVNSYHLPDIMLVWSVFHGINGSWFLSADASSPHACHLNQNSLELRTSNGVKMDARNVDDDCRSLSSDINRIQALPTSLADGVTEDNVVSEMVDGLKVEKSLEKKTGLQSNNHSQVNSMGTESRPKKKRKVRHTKDVFHDPSLEESPDMFHASDKDTSMTEIVVGRNPMIDALKEGPANVILFEQQGKPIMSEAAAEAGVRNDQFNIGGRVVPEGIAPAVAEGSNLGRIVDSQNLLDSDKRKEDTLSESINPENLMASKLESEPGQDVPPEESGCVSVKVPDVPTRLINASGATGDGSSDGSKRKKKKSQKIDAEGQDTTDGKQTRKGESTECYVETNELEKKEEERDLSLNCYHGSIMPLDNKASVHADPKEASFSSHLSDKNAIEPDVSSGNKKKRRVPKPANTNLEKSGTEQTDNGICGLSGLVSPLNKHILEETDKGESISCHQDIDVQMKLLNDSTKDAREKAQGVNTNEEDFVILTQTEQTLEDVITEEQKNQSSAGNHHEVIGKENPVAEVNHVDKESENTKTRGKKVKKNIKVVQRKSLNGSTKYASEKVQDANTDEANFSMSTQTKPTLEDGTTVEKKTGRKDQSSADNCDAATGKENQMVEFDQVEKDSKNTDDKGKKAKRKIKKRKVPASGVQENLPIKDQKVGTEVLATEVNSISFVESKEEGRHVATSPVLSHNSEEKPEEMHTSAVNTDDLTRTPENGGEGINFKQYFVPDQYQDQVDSSDEITKTTKSNEEMKIRKKVKENGSPSLGTSTKLQNSLKPSENHEGENKSRARKKSGKRQGDSGQNSDQEEVIPNSSRRSLKVSENGVKDSRPSEMQETMLQKSNDILAASTYLNKKKPPLHTSSERSMTVPKNNGNKKLPSSLNVSNKMAMNTAKKNSLLSKTGALFQDSSSGGSEDESETVHMNVRPRSPSDTSSLSDYSVGESDLSQDSPRNVSNDEKGRSTGRKNMPKLDLSASKDMTMDMILRSSKRFKKAKLLVDSQNDELNESQQVEFVPESQPI